MNLKITVVRDLCIAAGTCLIHAPKTFDLDKDNIAYVIDEKGDIASDIIAAAKSCPTLAILLENADTGEKIWPKE